MIDNGNSGFVGESSYLLLDRFEHIIESNLSKIFLLFLTLTFFILASNINIKYILVKALKKKRAVEEKIKEAVKRDRAKVQFGKISRFGLLELSRQRLRPSLKESSEEMGHLYEGIGRIRNIKSMSLAILRRIEEESLKVNTSKVIAEVPIKISTYLMNEKRKEVNSVTEKNNVSIIIIPDVYLESPNYRLTRYRSDNDETGKKSSYELIDSTANNAYEFNKNTSEQEMEPTVQGIKPQRPIPVSRNNNSFGLINFFKKLFFGDIKNQTSQKRRTKNNNPNYKGRKFNKNYKGRNKFSKGKQYNKKS